MGDQKPRERQIRLVDTGERQAQEMGRGEEEDGERQKQEGEQAREGGEGQTYKHLAGF